MQWCFRTDSAWKGSYTWFCSVFQVICRVVQIVDCKFWQYLVHVFNSLHFYIHDHIAFTAPVRQTVVRGSVYRWRKLRCRLIAEWPTHSSEPWDEDPELLTSKLLLSPYTTLTSDTFTKELQEGLLWLELILYLKELYFGMPKGIGVVCQPSLFFIFANQVF